MKLFYSIALLSILAIGCKTSKCVIDIAAVDEFKHHLDVIKSAEEGNSDVYVDDFILSLVFLSNITGIISRVEIQNWVGYKNTKELNEDISRWEGWLKNNKCKLSRTYIDSAMSKNRYVPNNN